MTLSCQIWKPVHMLTSKVWGINLSIGYIGQVIILHILKLVYMSKEFVSFNLWNIWCQTCESLNVNVTTRNSCNPRSLHLGLQSLELLEVDTCVVTACSILLATSTQLQRYVGVFFPFKQQFLKWLIIMNVECGTTNHYNSSLEENSEACLCSLLARYKNLTDHYVNCDILVYRVNMFWRATWIQISLIPTLCMLNQNWWLLPFQFFFFFFFFFVFVN